MNNYGRRLKRYLFLKREKLDLFGGIEEINPDKISGWLFSKKLLIDEIRLYLGPHLISKSFINLERKDVANQFNCNNNCGFNLIIPQEMPEIDFNQEIKIVGVSNIKLKNFEIKCLNKKINHKQLIKKILNSDVRGSQGHFDGLNNDFYYEGWAAKADNQKALNVWLQCMGKNPLKISCSNYRDDLNQINIKSNSGFLISLKDIPIDWEGCKIWCTFDEEGVFKLPQKNDIKVENLKPKSLSNIEIKQKQMVAEDDIIQEIPSNFEEHWKALEEFNLQLNDIENKLNESHLELLTKNVKNRKSIMSRIFKN